MSRSQTVLVIDDDQSIRQLVPVRLKSLSARIVSASGGPEGIRLAAETRPDLILLDVSMPEMDGFEVCRQLRDNPLTRQIPVIFLTGSDEPDEKSRGFELGAVDYVTKPFDPAELRARVRNALRTQALLAALEVEVRTDRLTGLPNRRAFSDVLQRCIERCREHEQYQFAVLFIDLDRFKLINDSLGHQVGDELLVAVADRLRRCIGEVPCQGRAGAEHVIARMGGDEFTILLDDLPSRDTALQAADRLQEELGQPYNLGEHRVSSSLSVGIRFSHGREETDQTLLRDSDAAMYHAKSAGKGRYMVFDEQMHETAVDRLSLENDLREALEREQFELHYQPIIRAESGTLVGFEALLRWHHPQRGLVAPDRFIPIVEENGGIHRIGRWVLRQALQQLEVWQRLHSGETPLHIAVNLSKAELTLTNIDTQIAEAIESVGIEPQQLTLEITESAIMSDPGTVVPVLERLRRLGVRLAMDDFGTGHSSLALLHKFPLDALKIDRSFIVSMSETRAHSAIVGTIVMLAQYLGLEVIAEGVETNTQLAQLLAMDCDCIQGYYFGKPAPAQEWREAFNQQEGRLAPAC